MAKKVEIHGWDENKRPFPSKPPSGWTDEDIEQAAVALGRELEDRLTPFTFMLIVWRKNGTHAAIASNASTPSDFLEGVERTMVAAQAVVGNVAGNA